jgi:8-oxo-dGTP pyrophosphatase MutT (NUDIX family)
MSDEIDNFKRDVLRALAGERATVDRSDLTRAAVLLPIVVRDDGPRLIFTTRTMNVAKHKGQISFPGGMTEPGDDGPEATALREAQEEIGLDPALVQVLGALDDQITITGFAVTPVVGFVDPGAELAPDPVEVQDVFEVPLAVLTDPARHDEELMEHRGERFRTHRYLADGDRVIWGATARIVTSFLAALAEVSQ